MSPIYREEAFLIIQPGSQQTLVRFGLEDALAPPTFSVPTKVYRNPDNSDYYTLAKGEESNAVYPIVKGEIVEVNALNFLLKCIVKAIVRDHPLVLLNTIPLTLIQSSSRWSNLAIEQITNYVFEKLQFSAFTVVPSSLCSTFAYGSIANALVVDVGYEKTEITPIIDYQTYTPAIKVFDKGGNWINERLAKSLPDFSAAQIEALKKSPIYEVLSEEDAQNSFFGLDELLESKNEDEGVLDIAAIVTSDKSTREILEEKEKERKKAKDLADSGKPNSELESNTFVDQDGKEHVVGKERFQGSKELIHAIVQTVYTSLSQISDIRRVQDCYDNLILSGQTTKIKGFKEALLVYMYANFVVGQEHHHASKDAKGQSSFRNDANNLIPELNLIQAPKHVKILTRPEYFSEWKKVGFEDSSFLGGEILSKQIFGSSHGADMCLTKEDYLEKGPMGIWHIKM